MIFFGSLLGCWGLWGMHGLGYWGLFIAIWGIGAAATSSDKDESGSKPATKDEK